MNNIILIGIIIIIIIDLYTSTPVFYKKAKWTIYIYTNLSKLKKIDNKYYKLNNKYIVVFYKPWLFEIYEGATKKEIKFKYSLGGQSNKADYLTWWEKIMGYKIEKWYKGQ